MNPIRLVDNLVLNLKKASRTFFFVLLPCLLSAQIVVTLDGVNPTCNGWANGNVVATVTGGTLPLSYSWNGGPPTGSNTLASIGAGTYEVVVTDANSASASASITLVEPDALVIDVSNNNSCAGGSQATASVSGGTGGYTYLWETGATTANVSGLSPGNYCVVVTDENGCQATGCTFINSAMALEFLVQGLACFNFCDASVEADVTGGAPPYTYDWSNGANSPINANLGPGTYSVTITDQDGCTISGSADVINPFVIDIDVAVTNPSCGSGGTGSATATATGGNAPYTYEWSNGATGPTVTDLPIGSYGLTVTDFIGCQGITTFVVMEESGVAISVLSTPSSGCGAADGTVSVFITEGTPPFSILWDNGSTASDVANLPPGDYTVMVTDGEGCGATATVTVEGALAMDLHIMGVNAGCIANGSANAMVMPGTGTPPIQYVWNTGDSTSIINNIGPGTYSVTATDSEGCTAVEEVVVNASANISVSTTATDNHCFGENSGTATANATGATGQVDYSWSNGGDTQTISDLATGTYFVTVTDTESGCTAMSSAFVGQPTELTATVEGVDEECGALGSATASATGGTPDYTFEWNTGATGATLNDIVGGTYHVTVTDMNGCVVEDSVTIAGAASVGVLVEITIPISDPNASDGAVTATVTSGLPPFTYLWNTGDSTQTISDLPAGTYTVTVTSSEGCTGTGSVELVELGCIGNKVWEDLNRDGCQDTGEFGFAGVQVNLTGQDVNGNAVNRTMTTAANGSYLFENLVAGDYVVQVELPTNYAYSSANACGDDFTDSDIEPNGNTGVISILAGECTTTVDAGIYNDCLNITDPGEICCDQYLCGPGNDPDQINSTVPATGAGSAVEYLWMSSTLNVPFNPNFWSPVPGGNGASYDPGPLQETTYFIRCAKGATCDKWYESNAIKIEVGMDAFAEITGPDLVCVGDEATYSATSNGPNATYSWDFGQWATPSTSNEQSPTITWTSFGVAYITLTVTNNGCTSSTVMGVSISNSPVICGSGLIINGQNNDETVDVNWDIELPDGDFRFVVQRSGDGDVFDNIGIVLRANGQGLKEYTFTDYFPKEGNSMYRVELQKGNSAKGMSNEVLIRRFDPSQMFMAYPNPTSTYLRIEYSGNIETAVGLELWTIQGKLLYTDEIPYGKMNSGIDMSQYRAGTYMVHLTYNDGQKKVFKIVKQD